MQIQASNENVEIGWVVFTHSISDTKYVVGFFLTPTNSPCLQIPTGCPTIQSYSDSGYSEWALDSQV